MKKILLIGCLILITACQSTSGGQTETPAPAPSSTATVPPTPIPFTVTPEPTATLALSPTPFPRFFTDEFDSSLAGWVILQAGNESVPNIKTENSNFILQMDSPFSWLYAIYEAQDYANVRIDAQFTNQAGSPSSMGLICRYSEEDGWFEYNVSTDGSYNLLYGSWLAVGIADYLPITDGASNLIQPSGAPQLIGLVCSDTALALYINDTIIRNVDVANYGLTEGKVGITASSYENTPVVVALERMIVSEP
ncbi:MAG: hypothetical protein M3R47_09595 [Chloroflexota bacterium]|nr:hypothetical protein [Chloroflexota bacterium]